VGSHAGVSSRATVADLRTSWFSSRGAEVNVNNVVVTPMLTPGEDRRQDWLHYC
jgi:hypothetical protein